MKSEVEIILNSFESQADVSLANSERTVALSAMIMYAERAVENYRKNEAKAIKMEAVKLFPALLTGQFKLWLRKISFMLAKKKAIRRANMENRKIYVLRSSDIAYTLLSTSDVKTGKKIKALKKNVGALQLTETADFIAYPQKNR